jgi:hypothetical protein
VGIPQSQSAGEVKWLIDELVGDRQPSILRMLICPEACSAKNNIAGVTSDR